MSKSKDYNLLEIYIINRVKEYLEVYKVLRYN